MDSNASTANSSTTTRSSSPCTPVDPWVSEAPVHPLAPLGRDYPKPQKDIDVGEALLRQPLRWSIQGQIDANKKRQDTLKLPSQDAEFRRRDLQRVKKELLASYLDLERGSKH